MGCFQGRLQRMRTSPSIRSMVQEVRLHPSDFIAPLFVTEGEEGEMTPLPRYTLETLPAKITTMAAKGIRSLLLFGIPEMRDQEASAAYKEANIVARAISLIRKIAPSMVIIADLCFCHYTENGQCAIYRDGVWLQEKTLSLLAQTAISYAAAGADIIAPSGMVDGGVMTIRRALNDHGYALTAIMAYSVKYASSLYGPFRTVTKGVEGTDRRHHQMNPSQRKEALLEAEHDVQEGADYLIVKPAIAYLDIIHQLSARFLQPIVAYQVSGEYAMVKEAAMKGIIDERNIFWESFIAMKRAGASLIISYDAEAMVEWLCAQ